MFSDANITNKTDIPTTTVVIFSVKDYVKMLFCTS